MPKHWLWLLSAALLQGAAHGDQILIGLTNQVWRYEQSGTDLSNTGWQNPDFDDSSWLIGRGVFAYETSSASPGLSANVYPYTNTVLALGPVTHHFRTHFEVNGDPSQAVLVASNLVDDGCIIYLNGVEVNVYNMNASRTLAAQANPQGEGTYIVRNLCFPSGTLRNGDNLLAVAVYQNSPTSSDVVWGTVLHSSTGYAPRILLPTNTVNIPLLEGRTTNLSILVDAPPCVHYQWFFEGAEIPGATDPSYPITNMDSSKAGSYFLEVSNVLGSSRSASFVVSLVIDTEPPRVIAATRDPWDAGLVQVAFSEPVVDALDAYFYFLSDRSNFDQWIAVSDVAYGSSSNFVVLTLASPMDPARRYDLNISVHAIADQFGNTLADPTVVRVTIPTIFQNGTAGYTGTQDTEVRFNAPDSAAGGQAATVNTDEQDGTPVGPVHSLLRFDNIIGGSPGQVPLGGTILRATLRIYTDDQGTAPARVMRMLVDWNENSTWNSLSNGVDQINEAVQTATVDCSDEAPPGSPRLFDDIDVTTTVQSWANGQRNYGFAFLSTGADGWRWVTSENTAVLERPALVVDYSYGESLCQIVQQPESIVVIEFQSFTLSVLSRGFDLKYQWFKGGAAIPNATNASYSVAHARVSDAGNYYVKVSSGESDESGGSVCQSASATVTMCCGGERPQVVSAIGNPDQTTITVTFNDSMDATSAQTLANYSISGGLGIVSAVYTNSTLTLTTSSPREVGRNYVLAIQDLKDDSLAANLIFPNPTVMNLTQDVRLLSFDGLWKYQNEGLDLGTNWRGAGYDDRTWPLGLGLLGFETTQATLSALSNQNASVHTVLNRVNPTTGTTNITDYFRTVVNLPFATNGVTFILRHVTDDGAVFYVNGNENARFNMPSGDVNYLTTAPTAPNEGIIRSITNVSGFVCGPNIVAVEVHQQSITSGDVLFGAELLARTSQFLAASCQTLLAALNSDGTVTISWAAPMTVLEQADALDGEWSSVPDATSPLIVPAAGAARFYRLRGF